MVFNGIQVIDIAKRTMSEAIVNDYFYDFNVQT